MSKWQIAASSFSVIVLVVVGLLFWKHRVDVAAQRLQAQARLDTLVKEQARIANLESRLETEVNLAGQKAKGAANASQARAAASQALPVGAYEVDAGSAAASEYETMKAQAQRELDLVNAMYLDVRDERSTLSELAESFAPILGTRDVDSFLATGGQYTQDIDFSLDRWSRGIADISDDIKYNGGFTTESIERLYGQSDDYLSRARTAYAKLKFERNELDKEVQRRVDKAKSELVALGGVVPPTLSATPSSKVIAAIPSPRISPPASPTETPTQAPTSTPAATPLDDPEKAIFVAANVGDFATIKSGLILCFDSPEVMAADQQTSGDVDAKVDAASRIRFLFPGSRFAVTDESNSPIDALQVRIVSGDKAGLTCWISGTLPAKYFTHFASK